jgi:hypothetical protein
MNPLNLANRYSDTIAEHGYRDLIKIYQKTGDWLTLEDVKPLAREAIWLTATENPTSSVSTILNRATKLYTKWLRADYNPLWAEDQRVKRNKSITLKDLIADSPTILDKLILKDSIYECLDLLIQKYGIHLGIWAVMSYVIQEPKTKAQTIFQYMDYKPTKQQRLDASEIIKKLKILNVK